MSTAEQILRDPIAAYPAATVACFDPTTGELPRRKLDARRNVAFLERLASAGAPAVLIAASTGHGHLRTVDELAEWFTAAAEARLGGVAKMALLRPEDGLDNNRRLLELVKRLDYRVVFFRPGNDLPRAAGDAEIAANLAPLVELAADLGLPVGVYSIPDVSGVRLTANATAMLVAGKSGQSIVAAKITEAGYDNSTLEYLKHPALSRLKIVQGWDPFLARALTDGRKFDAAGRQRCGVTSGPMSFAVFQYVHILAAADAGNWDEVAAAQDAVTRLFAAMQDDPIKFADLQRAKFVMGLGHPLTGEVQPAQVERLFAALESLPRATDRVRLARSLDLMQDGPYHERLALLSR